MPVFMKSKGMYSRLAAKTKAKKEKPTETGSAIQVDPDPSIYDQVLPEKKKETEDIISRLVEPCEVILNVTFWSSKETSLVAVLTKADLKILQSVNESKVVLQRDLIKKGIKEVPIWEYGSNTREKLAKCPKFKLTAEDEKTAKKKLKEAKKAEESEEDIEG